MKTDLITPAESTLLLSVYADWADLTDDEKKLYIKHSSYYVQSTWNCVDIDWYDDSTIPEEVKEAIAYYAYADFKGKLFGLVTTEKDTEGKIKSIFEKVGEIAEKTEYYSTLKSKGTLAPFGYPDMIMSAYCYRVTGGSQPLTRV